MKYIIMDEINGDLFNDEFDHQAEAIKRAYNMWSRRSDVDKYHTTQFCVLESVNPDEDAINHFDGNPIWDHTDVKFADLLTEAGYTGNDEDNHAILLNKYDSVVRLMDDDLREELHQAMAPCSEADFLAAYLEAHREKFDKGFSI